MNLFKSLAAVTFSLLCILSSGQEKKSAVVEFSADFMREKPDYPAELGDQALMGTVVKLLDTSSYWVRIMTPEPYVGWVNDMGLVPMSDKELQDYLAAPKYICTAAYSHIFEKPSSDSRFVSEFVMGDLVRIMYKDSGRSRAVQKRKYLGVVLPSGKTGYVPSRDVREFSRWAYEGMSRSFNAGEFGQSLVKTAMMFLGVPYMWGGTSIKNVDCSGLTRSVYFMNGVLLPRNASQQAKTGTDVKIFNEYGDVDWSHLIPGDLIFWGSPATASAPERISHVGMYIGGGRFIHSSEVVRINSFDRNKADFYDRKPVRARRIIGYVDRKGTGIVSVCRSQAYFPKTEK